MKLSSYSRAWLAARRAIVTDAGEDALRARLTELGLEGYPHLLEFEAALREHSAESEPGPLLREADLDLRIGATDAIALDLRHAVEDGALLFGRHGGKQLRIDPGGRVLEGGVFVAESPMTYLERAVRRHEVLGSRYLIHTPPENGAVLAAAAELSRLDEASDAFGETWWGENGKAIREGDRAIFGVSGSRRARPIVEKAAEQKIPLKLEAPTAVLMVRPPAKAPRPGLRSKGIEAPAWCHPRAKGVVRFLSKRRSTTISQWLFVDDRVLEILRPGLEIITWERFTGMTHELDGLLSIECVAWLRGVGATLDPRYADVEIPTELPEPTRESLRKLSGLTTASICIGIARHDDAPVRKGMWPVARHGSDFYYLDGEGTVHGRIDATSLPDLLDGLANAEVERLRKARGST